MLKSCSKLKICVLLLLFSTILDAKKGDKGSKGGKGKGKGGGDETEMEGGGGWGGGGRCGVKVVVSELNRIFYKWSDFA